MCAAFNIVCWRQTPVQRAHRAERVLEALGLHSLRKETVRCKRELCVLAERLVEGMAGAERDKFARHMERLHDPRASFHQKISGALTEITAMIHAHHRGAVDSTMEHAFDDAIRQFAEACDVEEAVNRRLAPFLCEEVAKMATPHRGCATRERLHQLRGLWPFNPRMPRLLSLDTRKSPYPGYATLSERELARRVLRVFVWAGATECADVSDALHAHMRVQHPPLIDASVAPCSLHVWGVRGEAIVCRKVQQKWQPRMDSIDFCRRRCIAEEWAEAKRRELNEWEELTHMSRSAEMEHELSMFHSPHHGPVSMPAYAGLTQRMRLAVREHASIKIQRATAQWLYHPNGPMIAAFTQRMVGVGVLSEPELDSEFVEVDYF